MKTFRAVSPMTGKVERLATDKGQATYKDPMTIEKGEEMRFEHDAEWAVAIIAPLVEPVPGRKTRYPVPLLIEDACLLCGQSKEPTYRDPAGWWRCCHYQTCEERRARLRDG